MCDDGDDEEGKSKMGTKTCTPNLTEKTCFEIPIIEEFQNS